MLLVPLKSHSALLGIFDPWGETEQGGRLEIRRSNPGARRRHVGKADLWEPGTSLSPSGGGDVSVDPSSSCKKLWHNN